MEQVVSNKKGMLTLMLLLLLNAYLVFLVAVKFQEDNIKILLRELLKFGSHDFARTTPGNGKAKCGN